MPQNILSIGHWPFQGRCPKSIPVPNPSHHGPNIPQCKLGTNKPPRLIKSIQNTITIADIHPHANWVPTNHLAYPRRHHHVSYTPPMQTRYQPTTSPTQNTITVAPIHPRCRPGTNQPPPLPKIPSLWPLYTPHADQVPTKHLAHPKHHHCGLGGRYQTTLEMPLGDMAKVCTLTLYKHM